MKAIKQALSAIDGFFFEETSPAPICMFRILLGLLVMITALLMVPDMLTLFGPESVVSVPLVDWWYGTPHFSIINMFPHSKEVVVLTWLALFWSSVMLTFGWWTRTNALVVLLCLCSFHHRNPFAVHSGDTLLRLFSFMLIFSNAGAMYSIDATNDKYKKAPLVVPIWVQRLIQLQLVGMYAQAFFSKVIGPDWQNGTALYWILKLEDYARFPLPVIPDHMWMLQICTWSTLWIEFALFTLIWVRPVRYYVLAFGIALHMGIEFALNIPVFELITMAAYVSFVDAKNVEQFVALIQKPFAWIDRPKPAPAISTSSRTRPVHHSHL